MARSVKKDRITFGASVIETAPTVLGALGLSLGENINGRVISGPFADGIKLSYTSFWEDTLENEFRGKAVFSDDEEGADEAIAQLIALGV
jgi:hypothetical protein